MPVALAGGIVMESLRFRCAAKANVAVTRDDRHDSRPSIPM